MVPMEIVDRVFKIASQDGEGTGFALDVKGRQYLVTAKHVVDDRTTTSIKVYYDGNWRHLEATPIGVSDVDLSVFSLPHLIARPEMLLDVSVGGFFLAQDVYFAGFPLGLESRNIDSLFPAPLVKKAIISGRALGDHTSYFYLDGHVNPGFSGAPVYLKLANENRFVVSMVVTSCVSETNLIRVGERDYHTLANSGIIMALSIECALKLIAHNPIGVLIDS